MTDEAHGRPAGAPLAEGAKAAVATIASIIPGPGTAISAAIWGALQADTTRRLNAVMAHLQEAVERSSRAPEELLADSAFRAGVLQLYHSTVNQEAESKLQRIQTFLRHRLEQPTDNHVVSEAVLRTFQALPASHIEAFLRLVSPREEDLRDFAMILGEERFDLNDIVRKEFPDPEGQDHCGSPADVRWHELLVLFGSLEGAALVRRTDSEESEPVFETTALAKDFIWHCLPPSVAA